MTQVKNDDALQRMNAIDQILVGLAYSDVLCILGGLAAKIYAPMEPEDQARAIAEFGNSVLNTTRQLHDRYYAFAARQTAPSTGTLQ